MRVVAAIAGCLLIVLVLLDVFNTIVLTRRTRYSFRVARILYPLCWALCVAIGRRIQRSQTRESFLSIFGPLSFLLVLGLWAAGLATGFGLAQWAAGLQTANARPTMAHDLYTSATTLFTVETGAPQNDLSKWITVLEAGLGFSLLGLVISYLPVFYQAFYTTQTCCLGKYIQAVYNPPCFGFATFNRK